MTKPVYAWWFFGETLRDGRPIPADGEWLKHEGPLELCRSGLHASLTPRDALRYAPGCHLARVELDGEMEAGDDKLCARRRRILARQDVTALLRAFARDEARRMLHLWKPPEVVVRYLETGDKTMRQKARAAAAAAAYAATAYAATAAADAAYAADAYAATAAATAAATTAATDAAAAAADAAADATAAAADAADAASYRRAQAERFNALVYAAFGVTS